MLYAMKIYEGLLSYTLKTGRGLRNFTNIHTHTHSQFSDFGVSYFLKVAVNTN